jgi:hypothetical protein
MRAVSDNAGLEEAAVHKNAPTVPVRSSGRLIVAQQFTAGIDAKGTRVREADG